MSVFFLKARQKWACEYKEGDKVRRKVFATEQEAQAFNDEKRQESDVHDDRPTLTDIVVKFFDAHEDYHLRTKKNILYFLAGHDKDGKHIEGAGEFLRDKYADALNRKDLERMRENLKKGGAANATCNKYQAYIRAILAWAVEQELILLNPWRDFRRLQGKKHIVVATLDDFRRILCHAPEWLQWAFWTAFACSLRFGQVELFSLTWSAFNWRQGFVQLHQGKSGRVKRVYPPETYLDAAYQRYQSDMASGIVYVCHRGNGRKVLDCKTLWRSIVKKAGMEHLGIRPYDIRHVSATEMLANGVDPATVASQLGHSTPATTMNFYAHTTPKSQRHAGQQLPELGILNATEQLLNKSPVIVRKKR